MPAFFFGSQMISITELGAKTGHSHIKKQSFKMSPTSEMGVRRAKAALSSGCKPHPATAPAGSNRSSHGGNEVAEAFD
jgi:hypothetical protein